jgi:hypothetical protein
MQIRCRTLAHFLIGHYSMICSSFPPSRRGKNVIAVTSPPKRSTVMQSGVARRTKRNQVLL